MSSEVKNLEKFKVIHFNENLSKYNWFNLGGPAEIFLKPQDLDGLIKFLKEIKKYNKKINVLGAGSNTLIRDGGFDGIIIKLSPNFSYVKKLDEYIIEAGAATLDKKISDFATDNSLSGLEFLSCIPGTIGGGIRMNSGCYGEEISNILHSIQVVDFFGNVKVFKKDEIKFHYRGTDLPENLIILSVQLIGKLSKKEQIKQKQLDLINKKKISQPNQVKTCGSTFKNPKDKKAWQLIKESECEKLSVGNAIISEKHCNFFINNGKATSLEIEKLIEAVKQKVFEKTGINLELELKVIGKK